MHKVVYAVLILAVVAVAIITVIEFSGMASSNQKPISINETFGQNTMELPSNTTIPNMQSLSEPTCPSLPQVGFSSQIINSSGFKIYNYSNNVLLDYVLAQGSNGTIYYKVSRYVQVPTNVVVNNKTYQSFKYALTKGNFSLYPNEELSFNTFLNISENITTLKQAEIAVYASPNTASKIMLANGSYIVTVTIKAPTTAKSATYIVGLGPNFCSPYRFLLTIGNEKYTGQLPFASSS
jgi:hypothetical protein